MQIPPSASQVICPIYRSLREHESRLDRDACKLSAKLLFGGDTKLSLVDQEAVSAFIAGRDTLDAFREKHRDLYLAMLVHYGEAELRLFDESKEFQAAVRLWGVVIGWLEDRRQHDDPRLEDEFNSLEDKVRDWAGTALVGGSREGPANDVILRAFDEYGTELISKLWASDPILCEELGIPRSEALDDKPSPRPEAGRRYTTLHITDRLGVCSKTLSKRVKGARIGAPERGKRNHTYSESELVQILTEFIEGPANTKTQETASEWLRELKETA